MKRTTITVSSTAYHRLTAASGANSQRRRPSNAPRMQSAPMSTVTSAELRILSVPNVSPVGDDAISDPSRARD